MTTTEIAWLAGLLEGEGCFHVTHSITIALQMTDEDVVRRAARLMDTTVKGPRPVRSTAHKPLFSLQIHGKNAASWMMTILPLMGIRRRARIYQALARWKSYPVQNRDKEFCKNGHPLSGENLFRVVGGAATAPGRGCRTCQRQSVKMWRARRRMLVSSSGR